MKRFWKVGLVLGILCSGSERAGQRFENKLEPDGASTRGHGRSITGEPIMTRRKWWLALFVTACAGRGA